MSGTGTLSRVGDRVTDFLSVDQPLARTGHGASAALSHDEFERRVTQTVNDTGRTITGAVNVIGLSKVKETLGDRWEKLAARADDIARRAIERRMDDADVYTCQGDLRYIVLFAHLNPEQARLKCEVIAEEITRRLLGEGVAPAHAEVKTAVSQAQHDQHSDSLPGIAALAANLAAEAALPADALPAAPAADDWWTEADASDPLDSIRLAYRPLWDVRHNALAHYVCTPTAAGPAAKLLLGEDEIAAGGDAATVNRLDMLMQRQVIGDLRYMLAAGHKLMLCLPVHFETLASSSRRTPYLDRCLRGIPQGGQRFLAFELVGTPPGMPQGRLLELASALKRHARAAFMRVRQDHLAFRHPSETGIAAMGFTYRANGDERSEIENMQRFAASARKAGVACYVRGVRTLSLATSAIGAGFDYLDGTVIGATTGKPVNAYQFALDDLFSRHLNAAE